MMEDYDYSRRHMLDLYKRRRKQMKPAYVKKVDDIYQKYYLKPFLNVKKRKHTEGMFWMSQGTIKVAVYDAISDLDDYVKDNSLMGKMEAVMFTTFMSAINALPDLLSQKEWELLEISVRLALTKVLGVYRNTSNEYNWMMDRLYQDFKEVFPQVWDDFMAEKILPEKEESLLKKNGFNKQMHFLTYVLLEYGDMPETKEFVKFVIEQTYPDFKNLPDAFSKIYTIDFFENMEAPELQAYNNALYLYCMMEDPMYLLPGNPLSQLFTLAIREFTASDSRTAGTSFDALDLISKMLGF